MRLFPRKVLVFALTWGLHGASLVSAAPIKGDKARSELPRPFARPDGRETSEIEGTKPDLEVPPVEGSLELPVGLPEDVSAPLAPVPVAGVQALGEGEGERKRSEEEPKQGTLGKLEGLAAAPESARAVIDGAFEREVEEFLKANPAPTQEQFERVYNRVAPRLARYYDVRAVQIENLPEGGGLLLFNHVSLVDHFMILMAIKRPVRFIMDKRIFENVSILFFGKLYRVPLIGPAAKWAMRGFDVRAKEYLRAYAIPVLPRKAGGIKEENELVLRIARGLIRRGELVGIYPEGHRTRDGKLAKFGDGFMEISRDLAEPKLAVYIRGLWGALLSAQPQETWWSVWRGPARAVDVVIDEIRGQVSVWSVRKAMRRAAYRVDRPPRRT